MTARPTIQCELEFTGLLLEAAQARTTLLDHDGHTVPALCFVVALDGATHARCQVIQFFPMGQHTQCAAAARRLKQGQRVSFTVATVGLELHAKGVSHVHTLAEPATPTPQPSTEETTT